MTWSPISEAEIWDLINQSCERMDWAQTRLWDSIRIDPIKWQLHPWGDLGGGFWVVAIIGSTVVWYNDIEHGFNRSCYSKYGTIDKYWCNQDELEWQVQHVLTDINEGGRSGGFAGPPQSIQ